MKDLIESGSQTAKSGFSNEQDIADKFNNWKNDINAQKWLIIMNYDIKNIEYVRAFVIHGYKTDINVQVQIKLKSAINIENIQVKLVSNKTGYNQIDKRWLKNYYKLWNMPDDVYVILQYFVGELKPYKSNTKSENRMTLNEFTKAEQTKVLDWLNANKILVVADIMRGRGEFSAEWVLVAQKIKNNVRWVLKNINVVMHHYSQGNIEISPRGSMKIGKITVQRKGGDNGRDSANMLQFKIDPIELLIFNV